MCQTKRPKAGSDDSALGLFDFHRTLANTGLGPDGPVPEGALKVVWTCPPAYRLIGCSIAKQFQTELYEREP